MYTYNTLITQVQTWCNRTLSDIGFISQLPNFVSLAEQKIFINCPTLGNQQYLTGTIPLGVNILPKPALWGRTLMFFISPGAETSSWMPLTRSTMESGLLYQNNTNINVPNRMEVPTYYTDLGFNSFSIFPQTDQVYSYFISYFEKTPPLTPFNQTNYNSINAYDMLFEAVMYQASIYLQDAPAAAMWDKFYQTSVAAYTGYDLLRNSDRYSNLATVGLAS